MTNRLQSSAAVLLATASLILFMNGVAQATKSLSESRHQVLTWNRFANRLLQVHRHFLRTNEIRQKEEIGGYAGSPDFYRETSYFDKHNGRLLTRIRWETKNPDRVHVIEVFFYDTSGRVIRDYSAAYLPDHRNAPFQTLINLHVHNDDLQSFRQFDASGAHLYDFCNGTWFGQQVRISLDEPQIGTPDHLLKSEPYIACFGSLSSKVGRFIDPGSDIAGLSQPRFQAAAAQKKDAGEIGLLTLRLRFSPNSAKLYLERGNAYLKDQNFHRAIRDFNRALELDDKLDHAYFGRGVALGRTGKIDAGIADLTVFITRNPKSSLAYTKRGVRYIWRGDLDLAERDLRQAIELNPQNAEAHDDLGVILARRGNYPASIKHFQTTVRIDNTYQKGFHNLALAMHVTGRSDAALKAIERALELGRDTRSSVLLKATILDALGRKNEARRFRQDAETLPKKNWSENLAVQ